MYLEVIREAWLMSADLLLILNPNAGDVQEETVPVTPRLPRSLFSCNELDKKKSTVTSTVGLLVRYVSIFVKKEFCCLKLVLQTDITFI